MNLDLFPLGWVHLVASLLALAVGTLIVLRPKGTPAHKRRGRGYALTLLVTTITALGIYRRGVFFFPHWLAITALIVMTAGILAAHFKIPRKAWLHLHLTRLLTSLYILVGGGVNEIFLRVDLLHRLVPTLNSPAVGLTHLMVLMFFLTLIGYFNAMALRRSRKRRRAPSNAPAASGASLTLGNESVPPRLLRFRSQ
jgi:uncharacterized membrane protein